MGLLSDGPQVLAKDSILPRAGGDREEYGGDSVVSTKTKELFETETYESYGSTWGSILINHPQVKVEHL